MLALILLFLGFVLFMLSFIFIILDIENYKSNQYENLKGNELSKRSSQSLLFGLLALLLAVIISLTYT